MTGKVFNHFIVTRFNLRMKNWIQSEDESYAWMEKRIKIFEAFALPSVTAQSCQNFKWLLLFDPSTKRNFPDFLARLSQFDVCVPVFLDLAKTPLIDGIKSAIEDQMDVCSDYIITTRMDNDDAIHQDFVQEIQNSFVPKGNHVINFTDGYGYSDNGLSLLSKNKVNPFASFCEKYEEGDYKTVYCTGHPYLKRIAPVHYIFERPMCFVYFHEDNVRNRHNFTRRSKLIRHSFARYLCNKFPSLNSRIRYSYAMRVPESKSHDLEPEFHIKLR